jgi:hypothetical protein
VESVSVSMRALLAIIPADGIVATGAAAIGAVLMPPPDPPRFAWTVLCETWSPREAAGCAPGRYTRKMKKA